MSNLAYTRPLGVWNPGAIRAAELADLDAKTVKAPNFDGGGTYAPTAPITVGGEGMTIKLVGVNVLTNGGSLSTSGFATISVSEDAQFFMQGEALFNGDTYITGGAWSFSIGTHTTFDVGSFLNVNGTATFGALTAGGIVVTSIQVSESLYTAADSATNLNGTLSVAQAAYLHSDVHIEGTAHLEGATTAAAVTVNGVLSIAGSAAVTSVLECSGAGRVRRPGAITQSSGSRTISPAQATNWLANSLTGDLTLQISNDGADDGDELFICNRSATYRVIVLDTDGSLLFALKNASGSAFAMRFQRISGDWYQIDRSIFP